MTAEHIFYVLKINKNKKKLLIKHYLELTKTGVNCVIENELENVQCLKMEENTYTDLSDVPGIKVSLNKERAQAKRLNIGIKSLQWKCFF